MTPSRDRVGELARLSFLFGRVECLPPELMATQMLLVAVGVGGDRLVWRPVGADRPRFGKPSVTFLGDNGDSHGWFLRHLEPVVSYQDQADQFLRNGGMEFPTSAEIRSLRKLQEKYSRLLQEEKEEVSGFQFCHTEFVTGVAGNVPKIDVGDGVFGHDRIVLLFRKAAYEALNRATGHGPALRKAALNEGEGLRAALHGWVERRHFRRIVRKAPPGDSKVYGWMVPSLRSATPSPDARVSAKAGGIYANPIALRFLKPMSVYRPPSEIADMLDRADHEWEVPTWCGGDMLESLLRPGEELAWQLATALRMIGLDHPQNVDCLSRQAELVVGLASWIRASHAREIRQLFPGPPEYPTDRLSCDLADRLGAQPVSVRDLCRAIRGVRADQVRGALTRMEKEGWVQEDSRGHWSLSFPPLPDVSGLLSTFLSETPEEAGFAQSR